MRRPFICVCLRIMGHIFADFPVAAGDGLFQNTIIVFQNDGQPIQFPAEDAFLISQEGRQFRRFLGLIQRKDGTFVFHLHQIGRR